MSSLQNLDISDQEVKTMDIRSFLSGIEYDLPMKLWMGETTIEYKALVKSMVPDTGSPTENQTITAF
jgi:hypothetical protein